MPRKIDNVLDWSSKMLSPFRQRRRFINFFLKKSPTIHKMRPGSDHCGRCIYFKNVIATNIDDETRNCLRYSLKSQDNKTTGFETINGLPKEARSRYGSLVLNLIFI